MVQRDTAEHGTLVAYRRPCRCRACVEAFRARHREWYTARQIRTQGSTNRRVPIAATAEHLLALRASGWIVRKLAAEIGCSTTTLDRIVRNYRSGARARCWSTFEQSVLAIELAPPKRAGAVAASPPKPKPKRRGPPRH